MMNVAKATTLLFWFVVTLSGLSIMLQTACHSAWGLVKYAIKSISRLFDRLPMGTKSVLFGAHAFYLHPFCVAAGWTKLYGFPFDPRLWVAFFVHDLGYWGKKAMDDDDGQTHPELGARIMHWMFDSPCRDCGYGYHFKCTTWEWHDLSLFHSRHYAKKHGAEVSQLCYADKLAFCYQVKWLYLLMTSATGEIAEYLQNGKEYWGRELSKDEWYQNMIVHMNKVSGLESK